MTNTQEELRKIIVKFSQSGWDLIDATSAAWLSADEEGVADEAVTQTLVKAVQQADLECGSCGCEFDPLYKRALEILRAV